MLDDSVALRSDCVDAHVDLELHFPQMIKTALVDAPWEQENRQNVEHDLINLPFDPQYQRVTLM